MKELSALYSRSGFFGMWRGFVPAISSLSLQLPLAMAHATNKDGPSPFVNGAFAACLGTLLANPLEVAAIRYQNVDYNRGTLPTDIWEMKRLEGLGLFRAGYFHSAIRNLIVIYFLMKTYSSDLSASVFMVAAAALSQPFEVIKAR